MLIFEPRTHLARINGEEAGADLFVIDALDVDEMDTLFANARSVISSMSLDV